MEKENEKMLVETNNLDEIKEDKSPSNEEETIETKEEKEIEEVVIADKKVKLVKEIYKEEELGVKEAIGNDTVTDLNDIENERIKFYNNYKKQSRISNILMLVVLLFIIVAVILLVNKNSVLKIIGWVLVALLVVGMILYYALVKRRNPDSTKAYVEKINKLFNGYVFGLTELKDTVTDSLEKMELSDAIADKVYSDLIRIGSRNIVYGSYKDAHFKVGDLALYARGEKQQVTAFVGKYVSYPNTLNFDGRIIINICAEKPSDMATDILDLEKKDLSNYKTELVPNLSIYASEGLNINEIIKDKFLAKLQKIEVKDHLLNINLVIWGGHSAAYLSYDDAVIALPFDKEFDQSSIKQYRTNLVDVLSLLSDINK